MLGGGAASAGDTGGLLPGTGAAPSQGPPAGPGKPRHVTTRVRGHSGTYLGLLKEHFASPPVREADFRKILDLDKNGINQTAFETVEIPVIIS